jgi:YbbR domain-containing protein
VKHLQKIMAVKTKAIGALPEGYLLEKLAVKDKSVTMSGPESVLRGISSLSTEHVDHGDNRFRDGQHPLQVSLALAPGSLRLTAG